MVASSPFLSMVTWRWLLQSSDSNSHHGFLFPENPQQGHWTAHALLVPDQPQTPTHPSTPLQVRRQPSSSSCGYASIGGCRTHVIQSLGERQITKPESRPREESCGVVERLKSSFYKSFCTFSSDIFEYLLIKQINNIRHSEEGKQVERLSVPGQHIGHNSH